jgi:hypothetical protein
MIKNNIITKLVILTLALTSCSNVDRKIASKTEIDSLEPHINLNCIYESRINDDKGPSIGWLFPIDISPGQSTPLITNYIPGTDGLAFTADWYGCQT